MPASLPGENRTTNLANPAAGKAVLYDLLSGPKGSPLDVRKLSFTGGNATYTNDAANQNPSTGALSTGIGFGQHVGPLTAANAAAFRAASFNDDYTPGVTKPDGTASADSRLMYIGGGRSVTVAGANPAGQAGCDPYTAGFGIGGAGNGGSRDAGAGPAFTGFALKMVTASAGVAIGAAIESGFANRSPAALVSGQSTFGSATAASAAVA